METITAARAIEALSEYDGSRPLVIVMPNGTHCAIEEISWATADDGTSCVGVVAGEEFKPRDQIPGKPPVLKWRPTKAYATHALCADGEKTGFSVRPVVEDHHALYVVCFETEPIRGTQRKMSRYAKDHAEMLYRDRKCLVCACNLFGKTAITVYVAAYPVREHDAVLCIDHGGGGQNNMTAERYALIKRNFDVGRWR